MSIPCPVTWGWVTLHRGDLSEAVGGLMVMDVSGSVTTLNDTPVT